MRAFDLWQRAWALNKVCVVLLTATPFHDATAAAERMILEGMWKFPVLKMVAKPQVTNCTAVVQAAPEGAAAKLAFLLKILEKGACFLWQSRAS